MTPPLALGKPPRESVVFMATWMEFALQQRDERLGPDGWRGEDANILFEHLKNDLAELEVALMSMSSSPRKAILECADVANRAMMIADTIRQRLRTMPTPSASVDEDEAELSALG